MKAPPSVPLASVSLPASYTSSSKLSTDVLGLALPCGPSEAVHSRVPSSTSRMKLRASADSWTSVSFIPNAFARRIAMGRLSRDIKSVMPLPHPAQWSYQSVSASSLYVLHFSSFRCMICVLADLARPVPAAIAAVASESMTLMSSGNNGTVVSTPSAGPVLSVSVMCLSSHSPVSLNRQK